MKKRLVLVVGIVLLAGIGMWFLFLRSFGPVPVPVYDPDDAELTKIWNDYQDAVENQQATRSYGESRNPFAEKETKELYEKGKQLISAVFSRRMEELQHLRSETTVEQPAFESEEIPVLDGSSSCESIATILVARGTGVEYRWTNIPKPDRNSYY